MEKRDFLKSGILALGALILPGKLWSLKYYTTSKNKEWAILYGTWCGSSRDASVWISEGMNGIADVFDVRENPDLSGYKNIIIGGSIRSNVTPSELQDYLAINKDLLKNQIRAMFAVCGNMRKPVTENLYDRFFKNHLVRITGVNDIPSMIFLGRITAGLLEPEILKQMQSFPGFEDYDNLKRSECMAFGKSLLI